MADNILINEPSSSGKTIASKEDGSGVQHELVMIEFADVSGEPVKVSAANPLPVLASIDTTGLATEAKQDIGNTSLASIDGKLSGTLDVDTGLTQSLTDTQLRATPVPISATDLDIRDLAFATDKVDASGTVLGAGNNNIGDVDVASLPALVAGSAVIGKVGIDQTTPGTTNKVSIGTDGTVAINAAIPAGNNNIGDVDVASLPALAAGSNLIGIVQAKDLPDSSSTYALTNVSSTAYEASHVLKNGAGYLFMVTGYNSKTSGQFIQLHNSTTVPSDTAVPVLIFWVPASANFSIDLGKYGRYFSTGIAICNSSTGPTKTIGSADCWFDAQII